MAFQELIYPRRKNFIKNLNILLDTSPVLSPEKSIAAKFLHRNFSERSSSKGQSEAKREQRNPIKIVSDQKLFSLRKLQSKRQLNDEKKISSSRNAKSAHQLTSARNLEMNRLMHMINSRDEAISQRKLATQGSFRAKNSEINMNDQFQGRVQFIMSASTQLPRNSLSPESNKYKSVEMKRNSEGILYDYRPKENIKRDYLKKGSRIKSSILQNILKIKLAYSHQPPKYDVDSYIESREIFKLLKLFKGTQITERKQKKEENHGLNGLRQRQKDPLHIEGWLNEVEEFDDQVQDQEIGPEPEEIGKGDRN